MPEQTKLPGVIPDKDIDKTLSTIKRVIQNVWLVSVVKIDWYTDTCHAGSAQDTQLVPRHLSKQGCRKTTSTAGFLTSRSDHSTLDDWKRDNKV